MYRKTIQVDTQEPFAMLWMAQIFDLTSRYQEVLDIGSELIRIAPNPFYANGARGLMALASLALGRANDARAMLEDLKRDTPNGNIDLIESSIAYSEGDRGRALDLLERADAFPQLAPVLLVYGAGIATSVGRKDLARRFLNRTILRPQAPVRLRLRSDLWPLADEPPFAPRRSSLTLIWPAEAPAPPSGIEDFFSAVRYESALP
jgi:hypothetical protein